MPGRGPGWPSGGHRGGRQRTGRGYGWEPKPGTWEYAYLHRGPPGTPTSYKSYWGITSKHYRSVAELPGGRTAWVRVDPRYAHRHPEAVLYVGGRYYRAAVPSEAMQLALGRGLTEAQAYREAKITALSPFPDMLRRTRETGLAPAEIKSQVEREVQAMSALRGDALFKKRVELGFIPEGSVYISETQYLPPSEVKKIMRQSPELYETLTTEGWDAYLAEAERSQREYEQHQREYEQYQKELKRFEQSLKAASPDLYKIYKENGYEAYLEEVGKRETEYSDLMAKLKLYGSLPDDFKYEGPPSERPAQEQAATQYDIAKFLRDNHDFDPSEMIAIAGFSQEAIDGAIKYNEVMDKLDKPKYQLEGGYNLPLALKRGDVTEKDLLAVGFDKETVNRAVEASKASEAVALPGEKTWEHVDGTKRLSDADYRAMVADYEAKRDRLAKQGKMYTEEWDALGHHPSNYWHLTAESGRRSIIEVASFIFPAAKAALPEYTIKDISGIEWGLTGVNATLIGTAFAPGAILGSLPGKAAIVGISTTGAGMISYGTAKHWAELSPAQRAMGVGGALLYASPLLLAAIRGIKISTVKIPTARGIKIGYRGLSVAGRPIIGRSGGRWVVGAREITLPEARLILDGFTPETMLETKVFVNPKALTKAGFSQTQIDYLINSLKARNMFAGHKSAFLSKRALFEPTKYIDADEMAVFLRQIAKYNKKIKSVDMLYGGTTIKAQLAPKLRAWRLLHDLDMHTTFTIDEAKAFVGETLKLLRRLPGGRQYRISPKSPIRIEKLVDGKWVHMNDLKSELIDPSLQSSEVPSSKLDATGLYSYGRIVAEPAITVKYPGVGKFDIMSLSEAGVRKADTILRVRQTPSGTAFRPPSRGIAQPGVPKDAADFYVILRTFEESKVLEAGIADEWLEAWAKAMGYTKAELARVLPNIRKAALEVVAKTPSNLIGYRFTPASTAKVSPASSPLILIHIPSSLRASVSPSLAKRISAAVSLYSIASHMRPSVSAALSKMLPPKYRAGISPKVSKLSPASISARAKPSPGVISPKPSPKLSPAPGLSITTKPSPGIITYPSIKPPSSTKPSSSPGPSPPSPPPEPPKPPPPPPSSKAKSAEKKRKEFAGAIAWRQGALGREPKDLWYAIKAPYASSADVGVFLGEPPPNAEIVKGGAKSAFRSIQTITGKPPEKLKIDLGIMDIKISKPKKKPGAPGAIKFEKDVGQKTIGDITITSAGRRGKIKPRVTKEIVKETVPVASAISNKMPKEVAQAIGSYSAKVTPDGKLKVKVRRL